MSYLFHVGGYVRLLSKKLASMASGDNPGALAPKIRDADTLR